MPRRRASWAADRLALHDRRRQRLTRERPAQASARDRLYFLAAGSGFFELSPFEEDPEDEEEETSEPLEEELSDLDESDLDASDFDASPFDESPESLDVDFSEALLASFSRWRLRVP
jgi:hypothetical protein